MDIWYTCQKKRKKKGLFRNTARQSLKILSVYKLRQLQVLVKPLVTHTAFKIHHPNPHEAIPQPLQAIPLPRKAVQKPGEAIPGPAWSSFTSG